MLTDEQKKQMCIDFQMACDAGDAATIEAMLADDFTFESMERDLNWTVKGQTVSRTLDKAQYLEHGATACQRVTKDGMHFTIELAICDGPHVILLGDSHAISHNGKPYNNCYCWYYRFDGDKINHKREYRDTHLSRIAIFDD